MGSAWTRLLALAAIAACSLWAQGARTEDASAWLRARQTRFAAFQAAHPHPQAEIAAIKTRTAALVAAGPPLAGLQARLDAPPITWRAADRPI